MDNITRPRVEQLGLPPEAFAEIVARPEALGQETRTRAALHQRLKEPMSLVDLFFFVAKHDHHHLATITALARGSR